MFKMQILLLCAFHAQWAPNFITKATDPNFLENYIPVAGHNTMKVLIYLVIYSVVESHQTIISIFAGEVTRV